MSDLNDPRVLFAAERTLLAWMRTGLTLMGFGFVIERFGLFLRVLAPDAPRMLVNETVSFWVGVVFIGLGSAVSFFAALQHRRILKTFRPVEIPRGYWLHLGIISNLIVALLGIAIIVHLFGGLR